MMRKSLLALAVLMAAIAAYSFAACGPTNTGFDKDGGDGGQTADVTGSDDNPFNFQDGNAGDGSSCNLHCSSDLHDVLDCHNNVVTTCPADQGCGGASCVAACDAAKANKSSIGCDYYSIDPDIISAGTGACFAAYIANTWNAPCRST